MQTSLAGRDTPTLDSRGGECKVPALQYRFPCHAPETGYSLSNVGPWRRGRMRGRFGLCAAVAVALCSFVVAACGSDSGGGGGDDAGGSSSDYSVSSVVQKPQAGDKT